MKLIAAMTPLAYFLSIATLLLVLILCRYVKTKATKVVNYDVTYVEDACRVLRGCSTDKERCKQVLVNMRASVMGLVDVVYFGSDKSSNVQYDIEEVDDFLCCLLFQEFNLTMKREKRQPVTVARHLRAYIEIVEPGEACTERQKCRMAMLAEMLAEIKKIDPAIFDQIVLERSSYKCMPRLIRWVDEIEAAGDAPTVRRPQTSSTSG